jgi:coenzyme F420-reducing hydrogenase alpha subunit
MEVKGTIKKKLKLQNGTSKAGNEWQKLDVIITQSDEYSKEVCITAFGDKAIESVKRFNEGDSVEVSVNVESREYNGKYYTNITGWKWANGNTSKDNVTMGTDFTGTINLLDNKDTMLNGDADLPF